jgi:hypothetical protein
MANWTSLEQLEKVITRRRVLELFDDDGDGDLDGTDAVAVDETVAAVNDEVTSILFRKGFDAAGLNELSEDASLRRYATAMLAQQAGERRVEFLDDEQRGRFHGMGERARSALVKMSMGELRSKKEDTGAGENPIVGGDTNLGDPVFMVSRDPRYPGRPGPGGF